MKTVDETNTIDSETYYDFSKERYPVWILGSFAVMKKPIPCFVLNVCLIVCLGVFYIYGVVAGCYTMIFLAKDKSVMVQAFYGVGLMCVSFGLRAGRILFRKTLNSWTKQIRHGIFYYNEDFQDEYVRIKKKRVKQLKFLVAFISNGMFFCAFNNAIIVPLMQTVFDRNEQHEDEVLNPYLPFQIYVPFDTYHLTGYCAAYIANFAVIFTMYAAFACHEELYMCTTLQLTTELEVLRCSLGNIEKRALLRLKRNISIEDNYENMERLYRDPEYQNCLYLCLRENILHHHRILSFRELMVPYMEVTTTVVVMFFSFLMAAAIVIMLQNTRPQLTLMTDIFGFLPMCWVGQLLANESGKTKDSLFNTPWLNYSEKCKVLLKMFMTNTQKPIMNRTKWFNINVSLETFADMVSIGYKIMNVMR